MTGIVVLTPEEARRRTRVTEPREVAWCTCPIWRPCDPVTCGNEAPVVPSITPAGWRVAR